MRTGKLALLVCFITLSNTVAPVCQVREYSIAPHAVYDLGFSDHKHGWAVIWDSKGSTRLFRTDDGGKIWRSTRSPADVRKAFFLTTMDGWLVSDEPAGWHVYRTKDGGASWSLLSTLVVPAPVHENVLFDFRFVNEQQGWFLFQGIESTLVLKTTDGGKTNLVDPDLSGPQFRSNFMSSFVASSGELWLVGLENRIAKKDVNTGWQVQVPAQHGIGANWYRGVMLDGAEGFVVGGPNGTILKTEDGGRNWRVVLKTKSTSVFMDISFPDSRSGCAVGNSALLYCTADGGEHWDELRVLPPPSEPKQFEGFERIMFVDRNHAYLIRYGGYIYSSSDGGKTWRDVGASFEVPAGKP